MTQLEILRAAYDEILRRWSVEKDRKYWEDLEYLHGEIWKLKYLEDLEYLHGEIWKLEWQEACDDLAALEVKV